MEQCISTATWLCTRPYLLEDLILELSAGILNSTTAEDGDLCHENGIGHQQLFSRPACSSCTVDGRGYFLQRKQQLRMWLELADNQLEPTSGPCWMNRWLPIFTSGIWSNQFSIPTVVSKVFSFREGACRRWVWIADVRLSMVFFRVMVAGCIDNVVLRFIHGG